VHPAPAIFRCFHAMGTRFECVLGDFASTIPEPEISAIAEAIEQIVRDEHARLSVFEPASIISEINRAAPSRAVRLDDALFALLDRCQRYAAQTAHAFDPAAGSLMEAFGFRPHAGGPPAPIAPGAFLLDHQQRTVRFSRPDALIDLGGIAKGYALDLIRSELLEHGATSAIIHGGTSSITAIGHAPDGAPWRVSLLSGDPHAPVIDLIDRSLACSSPSGRTADGVGHIMDTRTARPASGADAACVIGPSAEVCEAWSTALVVDPSLEDRLPHSYESYMLRAEQWHRTPETPSRSTDTRHEAPTHA